MEVKTGYKQTEVGVIPEEWDAVRMGDLFTFKNGLNKEKRFFGHGTPIVNYMDVFNYRALNVETIAGRVDVSSKELNAYEVLKGDVFFTRTSETVEEIGIAAVMLNDTKKTVYSGFVLRARPINKSLDDMFKTYCFSPRYFREQVTARASYTTRALTNGRSLSASLLVRPPLPEQRAIAAALSDMDRLLSALDQLITKKCNLKQATMQQLLTGKTRLSGFSGEWKVKRLGGELAEMYSGGTPTTSVHSYYGGDIPWVSISDMTKSGKFIATTDRNLTHTGFASCAAQLFPAGTVLYAMYASLGECSIADVPLCSSQAILGINTRSTLNNEFLYYYLTSLKPIVKSLGQHGTQANLNKGMVEDFWLRLPAVPEQTAIATVLSDMDVELTVLKARRDKTHNLKQAMMNELLTGKTRLVKPETVHA
jgi:type I restriction enzyme S subunit